MTWLVPTLVYVAVVGAFGVTAKLALRTQPWQDLIVWTGLGYALVAVALAALGKVRMSFSTDTWWAAVTGACAVGGLLALYVAIDRGPVSTVIAVSAAYPAVTLLLAAAVLAEPFTPARLFGTLLVIAGVAVLTLTD